MATDIESVRSNFEYSDPNDIGEDVVRMLDVAKRVHVELSGDDLYGPCVMGPDLWEEFTKAFENA